jgi:hypothetical protein
VVEAGGKRIVVDTCVGNAKERPDTPFHHLDTGFIRDLEAVRPRPGHAGWPGKGHGAAGVNR